MRMRIHTLGEEFGPASEPDSPGGQGGEPNLYEVLGLVPSATQDEIEAQCRAFHRLHHPEPGLIPSAERTAAVTHARDVLTDPVRRRGYCLEQATRGLGPVVCASHEELPRLESHLRYWLFALFRLDGSGVRNRGSFITQACQDWPSSHGRVEDHDWDRFAEALGVGLKELGETRVALLWTDVQSMLQGGLPDLLAAHSMLEVLVRELQDISLVVFLLGSGSNFPPPSCR
ncbi:MAG TPA: DnaJ domain-containing protein [Armatimonadota bacterium]|jgi:hypothetical protein